MILREIKNIYIKNRLTEGVDYEPYEWLGATTTTAIRGRILTSDNFSDDLHHLVVRAYRPTDYIATWSKFYYVDWEDENSRKAFGIRCNDSYNNNVFAVIKNVSQGIFNYQVSFAKKQWKEVELTWGSSHYMRSRGEISGGWDTSTNGMNYTSYTDIRGREMIFSLINDSLGEVQLNRWYFKGANGIIDLYPCKLIKDIPAFLSQDNNVHYAGECGMYNTIDGKFWFVQNSYVINQIDADINSNSGLQQIYQNKLIEGVDYETADWLKGDAVAYIDTKVTDLSISDYIKTIFDDSGNIGVRIRTWGREVNRLIVGNDNYSNRITVWGVNSAIYYSNGGIYVYDMYFDFLNNKVTVNNQIYSLKLPHGNGVSFLLFARHRSDNGVDFINLAKYKTFEIHNQVNLVPCTLLHSIPRNLDAQCKERQVGECGMIDLISGKFYGNVASSGTFTVENDNN